MDIGVLWSPQKDGLVLKVNIFPLLQWIFHSIEYQSYALFTHCIVFNGHWSL